MPQNLEKVIEEGVKLHVSAGGHALSRRLSVFGTLMWITCMASSLSARLPTLFFSFRKEAMPATIIVRHLL